MNPLPGFQFLAETADYAQLHRLLWRTPASSPPAASAAREPLRGPPQLRFIDLNKHPQLRVHSLKPHPPTVVVRGEYVEFMTHVLQVEKYVERRFFLTGQPGIGKHVGQATSCFGCLHPASPYFSYRTQRQFITSLRLAPSSSIQAGRTRETV
ncbi:hypothetical protein B0H14DRAFT_1071444 [Mycena olivaceomarginata]|nr:hypothetical protein B0H14DRAFT_1071444 [Mycena olivaceomarginata]